MASSEQVPTKYASISHNMYTNHDTHSDNVQLETEAFKHTEVKLCKKEQKLTWMFYSLKKHSVLQVDSCIMAVWWPQAQ